MDAPGTHGNDRWIVMKSGKSVPMPPVWRSDPAEDRKFQQKIMAEKFAQFQRQNRLEDAAYRRMEYDVQWGTRLYRPAGPPPPHPANT